MANNTQRPGAVERFVLDPTATNVREGLPTPMVIDNFTAQVQASQSAPTLNGTVPKTSAFFVTQTSTNAPVIGAFLVDDLGLSGNITGTRAGVGSYTITGAPAGSFTTNKSVIYIMSDNNDTVYSQGFNSETEIYWLKFAAGALADGVSSGTIIKIEVYP